MNKEKLKMILAKHDYLEGNLCLTSNEACLIYVCMRYYMAKNETSTQVSLLSEKVLAFAVQFRRMDAFIETLNFN